jgi:hypothetical protein
MASGEQGWRFFEGLHVGETKKMLALPLQPVKKIAVSSFRNFSGCTLLGIEHLNLLINILYII